MCVWGGEGHSNVHRLLQRLFLAKNETIFVICGFEVWLLSKACLTFVCYLNKVFSFVLNSAFGQMLQMLRTENDTRSKVSLDS